MVATVDVYQHVLAVPIATLVNEVTGKGRSDLPCHHVGGLSSTDCRPKTVRVNEMRRAGLMTELPLRMLM
jgi:hypothetical protein